EEEVMTQYTPEEEARVWWTGYSGRDDTISTRQEILNGALAVVKAAGYRVSKPKTPKSKGRVGPTFVCEFSDGTVVRMTTYCESDDKLDWDRGERLSQAAYQSRWRAQYHKRNGKSCPVDLIPVPPAIVSARFERDGVVLAQRNGGAVS